MRWKTRARRWRTAAGTIAIAAAAVALPAAQEGGQSGFQVVPGGEVHQEQIAASPLVLAAYAFAWIAVVAYVILLWRRLGRVERELADVRKAQAGSR